MNYVYIMPTRKFIQAATIAFGVRSGCLWRFPGSPSLCLVEFIWT